MLSLQAPHTVTDSMTMIPVAGQRRKNLPSHARPRTVGAGLIVVGVLLLLLTRLRLLSLMLFLGGVLRGVSIIARASPLWVRFLLFALALVLALGAGSAAFSSVLAIFISGM